MNKEWSQENKEIQVLLSKENSDTGSDGYALRQEKESSL